MNPKLVEKYIKTINNISKNNNYDNNITHLLYLIVPAFVTKYSIYKEELIINTLKNTKIITKNDNPNPNITAYYTSIPTYINNHIITTKFIIIENYQNTTLIKLLDNLVHELNHAVNSYKNEITITNNILYLRTGLTYSTYTIPTLKPLKKEQSYILEEILNTKQTEDIINIIKNYQDPNNQEINNTIYSINQETNFNYQSNSYLLQTSITKKILENKTFISTLNNLRISGNIDNINNWFDHITNQKNSYQKLNNHLENIMILERKLSNQKFFKFQTINKIKTNITEILEIINNFNKNCNYK